MRMIATTVLAACLIFAGCSEVNSDPSSPAFTPANTATAQVERMKSVHEDAICEALIKLKGVKAAHANAQTGQVMIALEEGASIDHRTLHSTIYDAGNDQITVRSVSIPTVTPIQP